MNDHDQQHEFDDELLSAYVDGELSAGDRAAVEARLDADPAARKLVEELRAVSQAVQGLPEHSLGRDLSDLIIERATAAKREVRTLGDAPYLKQPSRTNGAAPNLAEPMTGFSIGRSRRGLAWAAMAIAAALLIMFLQPNDELPGEATTVARRNADVPSERPADDSGEAATDEAATTRELTDGSTPSPQQPVPATEPTIPPAVGQLGNERYGGEAFNGGVQPPSPSASSQVATTAGRPPESGSVSDSRAVEDLSTLSASSGSGGPAAVPAETKPLAVISTPMGRAESSLDNSPAAEVVAEQKAIADEAIVAAQAEAEPELVVHVVAKRAAIENKAIDQLLAKCHIDVEPVPTDQSGAQIASGLATDRAAVAAPTAGGGVGGAKLGVLPYVDAVMVDAPESTIFSCVNDLSKDSANYVSVEVEETPDVAKQSESKALASNETARIQQMVSDLRKLNRGAVPLDQKLQLAKDKSYYFQRGEGRPEESKFDVSGAIGGASAPIQHGAAAADDNGGIAARGRAWRVPETNRNSSVTESVPESLAFDKKVEARTRTLDSKTDSKKLKASVGDQRMRVLLLICPEESLPASAGSENPPK